MHPATEAILIHNHGRDPERLTMKLDAIARDPFAFFRGTNHLYAAALGHEAALLHAPVTYVCGDLHIENFGSFKGDNGLVYFDLNDFDDALLGPLTVDLIRMLSSVMVAGERIGLSAPDARHACEGMLRVYAHTLHSGKPRWLERATATGIVATLLRRVKRRRRGELLAERTVLRKGERRLRLGDRALAADRDQRARASEIVTRFSAQLQAAQTHAAHSHAAHGQRFVALDAARRVAGVGSLGVERYIVLAQEADALPQQRLIDVKRAAPSAWVDLPGRARPEWHSDAQRVAQVQQIMQAASPALLAAVTLEGASYIVKSLQPTTDRVDLEHCRDKAALGEALAEMARAAAWAHLRGCGHHAADRIEQLQVFAAGARWHAPVLRLARHGCEVSLAQWKAFARDYALARGGGRADAGPSPAARARGTARQSPRRRGLRPA